MSSYISLNGKVVKESVVCISPRNRSFRYGDGFFETMRVVNTRIPLVELHFQRLFNTLQTLQFTIPSLLTPQKLFDDIQELLQANKLQSCRLRVMVYRGEGGLFQDVDNSPNIYIESIPLEPAADQLNKQGLMLDVFKDGRKNYDLYSALKTNSYLPYLMGAAWANRKFLDDCILLNAFDKVVECSIANLFLLRDDQLFTPGITEGCVDGVMRKYIMGWCRNNHIKCTEATITIEELHEAREVFVTNAVTGLKWVKKIGANTFLNNFSSHLYKECITPLWQ
ncbi:MAG: hypothetical protein JWQ96_227 [Segetibacter sp.]|nr:hypothetical protein [Segetibacter sp.]